MILLWLKFTFACLLIGIRTFFFFPRVEPVAVRHTDPVSLNKTPKSLTSAGIIEAFWVIQKHQESSNAVIKAEAELKNRQEFLLGFP